MGNESILAEVVAASIGGAFSASALYPLEVLKTKMQAESKQECTATTSTSNNESDSITSPKSTQVESNVVDCKEMESNDISIEKDDFEEKSSNIQSVESQPSATALAYAQSLYQTQGLKPFYAGIGTSAFQSATEKALYFFAYTALKNAYTFLTTTSSSKNAKIGTAVNLVLGSIAEWAHLPITLPIDCWTTKIQTSTGNKAPFAILMSMLKEKDGISGMYKGIQAYTVLCLKPAIQYTVFEQVKHILLLRKRALNGKGRKEKDDEESLGAIEAFFLGMVARTVATIVVFPYLRAKVMLQSQSQTGSNYDKNKPNIPAMIAKMYASGGLGEIFQGIGPELTRGIFSAALMMMVKEKISFMVHKGLSH